MVKIYYSTEFGIRSSVAKVEEITQYIKRFKIIKIEQQ